jgi:hypothetical protein
MTRTERERTLDRAVVAWRVGRPHRAWEILADAGLQAYWPTFLRTALGRARKGYVRTMSRYTA